VRHRLVQRSQLRLIANPFLEDPTVDWDAIYDLDIDIPEGDSIDANGEDWYWYGPMGDLAPNFTGRCRVCGRAIDVRNEDHWFCWRELEDDEEPYEVRSRISRTSRGIDTCREDSAVMAQLTQPRTSRRTSGIGSEIAVMRCFLLYRAMALSIASSAVLPLEIG
jgi:hypothetical protein